MKTMIAPGDKVMCKRRPWEYGSAEWHTFTATPKEGCIYTVRNVATDPETGGGALQLVGIYGLPESGIQPFISDRLFRKVSKSDHVYNPDPLDRFSITVHVTEKVAEALEGVELFPQVEAIYAVGYDKLQTVCRLWSKAWRMSKTLAEMHQEVAGGVAAGSVRTIEVPVSGIGLQDLVEICHHLEIEPEAWMQGLLGNMARRYERMREGQEMALRAEEKRRKRGAP